MNKKIIKIFIGLMLLIPSLGYCGIWDYAIGNRIKMSEMKSFAKDYAEKQYHRDYEIKALDWNSQNSAGVYYILQIIVQRVAGYG